MGDERIRLPCLYPPLVAGVKNDLMANIPTQNGGLKQNHTRQLRDLALGKPLQDLKFAHPDDSETIHHFADDRNIRHCGL